MQATKFHDSLSSLASIKPSIVLGSGLGLVLFITFALDLVTSDELNLLLKIMLMSDNVTLLNLEVRFYLWRLQKTNIME
jgi:hypothetical protein